MKRICVMMFVTIFLMGTMVSIYLPSESEGEIITWFSNEGNPTERTITLSGEGTPLVDASTYIEIPIGKNPMRSASIHLTNLEWENKYLTNPTLDVGVDGDIEWAFPGVMGHQTQYNDESPTRFICTGSSRVDTTTTIILPKNSDVTWATITLDGVSSGTIWKDDFETDKGWTLDTTGGWARGTPSEGTTSGTKALATYLTGNYPNNLAPTKWATSPTIDCGGYSGVGNMNLKFQRRLGVESSSWDDAYLNVYDGSNWVEVYHNGGTINEGSYSLQSYDVTAHAAGNPNFKVKFGLGPTDRSVVYTGWNIDDLEIELVGISGQSPQNSALDVGNDGGTPEWSYVPKLESPQTTPDFSNKLDALVQSLSTSFEDEYGNEFVEIPLKIISDPNGFFKLTDMDISYLYTATVNKNPHNKNLFTELNELIPGTSQGNFSVYLDVSSQTPGKIKISDVLIEYNEPPYLEKSIPSDKSIDEDGVNDQLIHLTEYFADDVSTPAQLIYTVESNSRPDKVYVTIYQSQYVRVASTIDNDWYGTVNITVSAADDKGLKAYSNEFTVTIDNVNDPPTEGKQIPDISLQEGGTFTIELDAQDYFVDIDSEVLYFEANVIDSGYTEYITLSVSEPGNLMMITSVGDWFGDDVPVRIYCDDAPITNIETIDVYQDILVNVVNVNDAPYWKSTWTDVSHVTIEEDKENLNWINLQDYVNDVDTSISDLSFSIVGKSNACIGVAINEENWINITTPVENYIGSTDVVFRVEDGNEGGYAEASLTVTIKGRNDPPKVEIFTPSDGAKLSGKVKIRGSSYDVDSTKDIESVKVKIGNWCWLPATGTVSWEFEWDTTLMEDGEYTIEVVAQDRETTSEIKTVNATVENVKLIWDEQYELDTDEDGVVDLLDVFPIDSSQWEDSDGDGYGDNQDGNNTDAFPYDPTQWEDKDGDGYGDNPKGNNPDEFPDDPNKHVSETAKKEREEKPISISTVLWSIVWVLIAINIITIIILVTLSVKHRRLNPNDTN